VRRVRIGELESLLAAEKRIEAQVFLAFRERSEEQGLLNFDRAIDGRFAMLVDALSE